MYERGRPCGGPRRVPTAPAAHWAAVLPRSVGAMSTAWPLVGRADELHQAIDALSSVRAAVLSGVAGVGKSRLAVEVVEQAGLLGWVTVSVAAGAETAAVPFSPFASLLTDDHVGDHIARFLRAAGALTSQGDRVLIAVDDAQLLDEVSVAVRPAPAHGHVGARALDGPLGRRGALDARHPLASRVAPPHRGARPGARGGRADGRPGARRPRPPRGAALGLGDHERQPALRPRARARCRRGREMGKPAPRSATCLSLVLARQASSWMPARSAAIGRMRSSRTRTCSGWSMYASQLALSVKADTTAKS